MKPITVIALGLASVVAAQPLKAEAGDWIIRLRAIAVTPIDSSSPIMPAFPTDEASVDTGYAPELDVTYMVTNNIGVELIAATTKHGAYGKSGVPKSIGKLATTWVLPPTLTVQYHFLPEGSFRPYVGAGLNYTVFYSEDATDGFEAAAGKTDVSLSDSFGWAVQAGADIPLSEKVFLNLDVKYIDIDSTARFKTTKIGEQKVDLGIDPLVFGIGLGMRF